MSPRRAKVSSGREASESDLGRIPEAFSSNLRAPLPTRHPPYSQSSCSRCSRHVGPFASWCLLVLCSGSSRRSLCFSPRVFRRCRGLRASARARLQAGAASRMFSQPSPGSSQKVPETSTRNSRNAPAPNARPARAACFRSLPRDRARKLRTKTLEKITKCSSSKRPASARSARARAARDPPHSQS